MAIFASRFVHLHIENVIEKGGEIDSVKPWQPFGNKEGAKFYSIIRER